MAAAAPLLAVALGAFVVLLTEVLLSGRESFLGRPVTREWLGTILALEAVVSLCIAALLAWQGFGEGTSLVFNPSHPMLRLDPFARFATALVCAASALACLLSKDYLVELRINHGEYYALLLLSTAGMVLLVCAVDLVTVFLGIELTSIPIYVLAGFDRRKLRSNESAFKYFLLGSFASAVLLYGIALLYGATGQTGFAEIRAAFADAGSLARVGLAMVLVGFLFKISAVPFHQWTPDVYEGAPTSVTAFMYVTVKVAGVVALIRISLQAFQPAAADLQSGFAILAVLTMLVGNVMAVIQDNLKRFLAYSSISHVGNLLVGFAAGTALGGSAILFYLLVYVFMNLGAFGVMIALANRGQDADQVADLSGLARTRPALAAAMTLFMLSLAGIPGTGGFVAKFQIFMASVEAGQVGLALAMAVASLVAVYYYLRIPVAMYMREPREDLGRRPLGSGEWIALALCAVCVLLLGVFPDGVGNGVPLLPDLPVLDWTRSSVAALVAVLP